jgi:hypothetical protein
VIEGTAIDALTSAVLEDVEVCALVASSSLAAGCTPTDAAGHYAIPALPPGSYKVGFWGEQSRAAPPTRRSYTPKKPRSSKRRRSRSLPVAP